VSWADRPARAGSLPSARAVGCRNRGAGWGFVPAAVDDATRLAYVEVLGDERKHTTAGLLLRALRRCRDQGILAEWEMTDNGSAYRSRRFAKTRGGWTSVTSSPGPTPQ